MASRDLDRIRDAILDGRYTLTEHAYDEMEADHLDVLDVESAILTGTIDQVLTVARAMSSWAKPLTKLRQLPWWPDLSSTTDS